MPHCVRIRSNPPSQQSRKRMEWLVNEVVSEHPGLPLPYLASVLRHDAQTAEPVSPSESQEINPMETEKHLPNSNKQLHLLGLMNRLEMVYVKQERQRVEDLIFHPTPLGPRKDPMNP